MVGWTILFALMAVAGATATSLKTASLASLLFGLLFVLSILTRAVRDRAR